MAEQPSDSTPLAYAKESAPTFPIKAPLYEAPPPEEPLTYWAQGVGAFGRIEGDGNAADVKRNLGGFFTGLDRRFGDWRAGLAGGFTDSSVSLSARASSANIDTGHVAADAGIGFDAFNLRTGAAASFAGVGPDRSIAIPGFVDATSARYGAWIGQTFGEIGYGMTVGGVAVEPFAGLACVHLSTNPFTESGGAAALTGMRNTDDVGYSTLGARAATNYPLASGMMLTPRVSAAWQYAFGTINPTATLAFAAAPGISGFSVAGVPLARNAPLIDAGLDLRVTPQATLWHRLHGRARRQPAGQRCDGQFPLEVLRPRTGHSWPRVATVKAKGTVRSDRRFRNRLAAATSRKRLLADREIG